jgi:Protein of unknown function (DUF2934)
LEVDFHKTETSMISATSLSKRGNAPIFDPADTGLRDEMIRQAAYFRSQHRRDFPGNELDDWLAAEHEIDAMIARAHSHLPERSKTVYPSRMCCY